MAYWLMKSEPTVYGIDHLMRKGRDHWEGVRNYQARNFIRQMQVGDEALFYHSNCQPPGIVGLMDIVGAPYPDHTAFDRKSRYFDAKSSEEAPRWYMVDVAFKEKFDAPLSLDRLRDIKELKGMHLLRAGNRLSVMPVSMEQWHAILAKL